MLFSNLSQDEKSGLRRIKKGYWNINWIKTIWFNLKALSIHQALKLPFIISYNVKVNKVGKIIIPDNCFPGMISIGVSKISMWESNSDQVIFTNNGTMIFHGRAKFHPGAKISVARHAVLNIGDKNTFGCNSKIICQMSISTGCNFRISWNGQIFDTDFHFLQRINPPKIYHRKKPVIIGSDVFAGNGVTIGKGTNIPAGCVISCCSKVSGDFSKDGENLLISGNPATVVSKGFKFGSEWNAQEELENAKKINEEEMVITYNKQHFGID